MNHATKTNPSYSDGLAEKNEIMEFILRDRMEHLGLMSSALVHEFQTPLIIMRGRVEGLLRHPEQDMVQGLREIADECKVLLKLLDAMTFVTPSGISIEPKPLALSQIVHDVLVFFEKSCFENGISIRAEISPHIMISSEPNRLKNILIALLSNAIDSFEKKKPGGDNDIRSISLHVQEEIKDLHLLISDTGAGMSPEVQAKILRVPFYSTKTQQKGSGLGLSLAQKMCTDLGIGLSFVSQKNHGSTFSLTFPKKTYSLEST